MAPEPCKVLCVCTGNACRSQMAAGWLRVLGGSRVEVRSAGMEAHGLDPRAVVVMREAGVDLSGQRPTRLGPEALAWADLVVTVCGHADARLPGPAAGTRREHWPLADPTRAGGDEAAHLEAFHAVRDEIRRRVEGLLQRLPPPVQVGIWTRRPWSRGATAGASSPAGPRWGAWRGPGSWAAAWWSRRRARRPGPCTPAAPTRSSW